MTKFPSLEDWQKVKLIASNVNDLVDDADPLPMGLLALFNEERVEGEPTRSKFASKKSVLSGGYRDKAKIIELIPQAESLGNSRSERIANLRKHCKQLKAYSWLANQEHFKSAKTSIAFVGKLQKIAAYLEDVADFKLICTFAVSAGIYQEVSTLGIKPRYPTRAELKKLSRNIDEIVGLIGSHSFQPYIRVNPFLLDYLADLKEEIDENERGWIKPHADSALNETVFLCEVIENFYEIFGACSPAVLQHVSGIFGISFDDKKVKGLIKQVETNRTKNPPKTWFYPWGKKSLK